MVLEARKMSGWTEYADRGEVVHRELDLLEFGDEQLNRVGIVTFGRLSKLRSRAKIQKVSEAESGERIELARLKAKYEK
jgi:hypothetical protein